MQTNTPVGTALDMRVSRKENHWSKKNQGINQVVYMDKTNKWIQNRSNKIVIKNHDISHQWTALKSTRNTFFSRNLPKRKTGD